MSVNFVRAHILVCAGTGCSSSNSAQIISAFERELQAQGMAREARVVKTGCFGLCAMGPVVLVYPEGAFYTHVKVSDVEE
jgi:NADP-reducing hydrogenase subunit HndC